MLNAWERSEPTTHTVPLPKNLAKLIGVHLAASGRPRAGLGLILQAHCGMRPSEMLALTPRHVALPTASGHGVRDRPTFIALGVKVGTKVRREQVTKLLPRGADISEILALAMAGTAPDLRLFPISMTAYRSLIRYYDQFLQINAGFGAHSPRSGYATDSLADGIPFEEIREVGRWTIDASLRRYLDEVSSQQVQLAARSAGLGEALRWVARS